MDNTGRVDYNIAHYLVQITMPTEIKQDWTSNDVVVFLNDNVTVQTDATMRDLRTMLKNARVDGFGCALEPKSGKSFFHFTHILATFHMDASPNNAAPEMLFKSQYENMGAWLRHIGISLPEPITPVCYGGNFAVERSRIEKVPHYVWLNLERSLSRGDTIEEGFFAERMWAGLLYRSLTDHERELLFQRAKSFVHLNEGMRGAMMKG